MKRTFVYKEKFSFSCCYYALIAIALAVWVGYCGYGISFRKAKILPYPYSLYVLIVFAIAFTIYAYYKYSNSRKSAANPNPLEIDDNGFSFPKGANSRITVAFADVRELSQKTDEDAGKQLTIYTVSGERHEFSEDRFASGGEFAEFEKIMNENCTKKHF